MAGHGPAPKETRARERDQRARESDMTVVAVPDAPVGPELPDGPDWPDATREWWSTWRTSPQALTFTATDWSFLLDTAILHMEFWDGNMKAAAELRLRVAKFGATPEDRARLRISVGKPEGSSPAPAAKKRTPATRSRKDRVLKAVEDAG